MTWNSVNDIHMVYASTLPSIPPLAIPTCCSICGFVDLNYYAQLAHPEKLSALLKLCTHNTMFGLFIWVTPHTFNLSLSTTVIGATLESEGEGSQWSCPCLVPSEQHVRSVPLPQSLPLHYHQRGQQDADEIMTEAPTPLSPKGTAVQAKAISSETSLAHPEALPHTSPSSTPSPSSLRSSI